ncbi:MAG: hypothetical protein ACOYL3_16050 [Desulfuromonadaceae bacterium]
MQNAIFAYPDRTLSAIPANGGSISGGLWRAELPLSNLQNKLRSKVARSTNDDNSSTIIIVDLGAVKPVRMLAMINHNASQAATATLSFSAISSGGFELGHPSGLEFWPSYYPPSVPYEWSEDEFWSGKLYYSDAVDYKPSPDFWYVLPQVISARYIKVEIFDNTNPAGYFELGRLFIANGFQPQLNIDWDSGMSWKQDVDKTTSLGGVDWFNIKSQHREISGTLSQLSVAEGMVHVFDRQRRLGLEGELYFIFDPDDTLLLYKQRSMLCRHGSEDPLRFPSFNRAAGSFHLVEVI